ncbi:hypothetical protein R1flu_001137 [Riccia fluitans]|uniref:t-SNARE coiled-coil homology domain-containing protein n=1 Tax=Riccia fluitans TaxID=41844 RepID=A0ABD1Y5D4_9MARC
MRMVETHNHSKTINEAGACGRATSGYYAFLLLWLPASIYNGVIICLHIDISIKVSSAFFRRRLESRNTRRYDRNRNSLFDTLEEGGVRASSSYSTSEIAEQENDRGIESIGDRVSMLKKLTTDIHDEVDNHNRMLERMVLRIRLTLTAS